MKNFKEFLLTENRLSYINRIAVIEELAISESELQKIGEGDNGIAYLYKGKVLKITADSDEADFFGQIKGHDFERVANCYDIIEFDFGETEEDNKIYGGYFMNPRYFWVIIKEHLPGDFYDNHWHDIISYYYKYEDRSDFNHTEKDFDKMIHDYYMETVNASKEEYGEEYDPEEDDELNHDISLLNIIKELHMELNSVGIISVNDMKTSNMGIKENGEVAFIEVRIAKDKNLPFPQIRQIKMDE